MRRRNRTWITLLGGGAALVALSTVVGAAPQVGADRHAATPSVDWNVSHPLDASAGPRGTFESGYDLVGSDGGIFVSPPGRSSGYFGSLPQ